MTLEQTAHQSIHQLCAQPQANRHPGFTAPPPQRLCLGAGEVGVDGGPLSLFCPPF